jgi:hypothetical protein
MRSRVIPTTLVALGGAVILSGCSVANDACAEAYETAALAVDEVATVNFGCQADFEHSMQSGSITISVATEEAALPVMDKVYLQFASSDDLEDAWDGAPSFFLEGADKTDSENLLDPSGLGIRDDPSIYDLREHYGIHPPGSD